MRLWFEILRRVIPAKMIVVAVPFALPLLALVIWLLIPKPPPDPLIVQQEQVALEYARLLPRAESGDGAAQIRIAAILRDGLAGNRDPEKAVAWLTRAAHGGHAEARYALGQMYAAGQGVRQNYKRAAEWYHSAARFGGHAGAQYALGELYAAGRGVANDIGAAVTWYLGAAKQGHAAAQFVVGSMYEKGWGVDGDLSVAYYWYTLSARQAERARAVRPGIDPEAARATLAKRMSRLELIRAREKLAAK